MRGEDLELSRRSEIFTRGNSVFVSYSVFHGIYTLKGTARGSRGLRSLIFSADSAHGSIWVLRGGDVMKIYNFRAAREDRSKLDRDNGTAMHFRGERYGRRDTPSGARPGGRSCGLQAQILQVLI